MRILVIDNFDSFVYTLTSYLWELGVETEVVRNDALTEAELEARLTNQPTNAHLRNHEHIDAILISPGPGTPKDAGISIAAVRVAHKLGIPVLGVCLGHQAIAQAFGATVAQAPQLVHGMSSQVRHTNHWLFEGLPDEFAAGRYHSLAIVESTLPATEPAQLNSIARTPDGVIMGVEVEAAPIVGVQFHPESVLTEGGYRMLRNWLQRVNPSQTQIEPTTARARA